MCRLSPRPRYVCTAAGIHLPTGRCVTTWSEITRVEAAKLAGGDELNDNTYYLFVHARRRVFTTDSSWDNVEGYAALLQGLLTHLPGFRPDWQQVVDRRFAQTTRWNQVFATFYYKDKVVVYPRP
ncbi:hypothetical protein [Hymenobacter arizonensis]|uniref:Uncharacterized protein n=1 Tax=Hymenobacter arizonensis TaxID=1227077 RepID=A0A1I6BNB7_HYMAR|nr:hypothetical protein [Hymenobacter arizonensis]SFQ82317.1 hypothetical protein SAMN04515668_4785 [Hymenobacter arizonensis]